MFKDKFCVKDSLLEGIDFEELIITLQSNEQEINKTTINRVFEELLKAKLEDAREVLKHNINNILKEC